MDRKNEIHLGDLLLTMFVGIAKFHPKYSYPYCIGLMRRAERTPKFVTLRFRNTNHGATLRNSTGFSLERDNKNQKCYSHNKR